VGLKNLFFREKHIIFVKNFNNEKDMNTSFHFGSAQEITPNILDVIKQAYQEKPVMLYVREDVPYIPEWQKDEVRRRVASAEERPENYLDFDEVMNELTAEYDV
jgi:hypothetical protein